ncbi:MAG: ABC transporter permease [Deltaproteobacteria bacterium]|nr:ABC transporter permease [Deltaproteobacteria bacterium]
MAAAASQPAASARLEPGPEGLRLSGHLDAATAGEIWRDAMDRARGAGPLVLDVSGLDSCDAAGAVLLVEMERARRQGGGRLELRGLPSNVAEILEMVAAGESEAPAPEAGRRNFFEALGSASIDLLLGVRETIAYVGALTLGLLQVVRNPRLLRFKDVMLVAERAGIGAVPIVALIGFLLGLILSFQSLIPMQRFGAEIFIADLLGMSLLRELGPLMAAIMLTARSGSAFAAEIGTMKVNEEVDALATMGLEPMRFLILPRVVAAIIVVPVLAMLMNAAGLAGGAVMFLTLDFPLNLYISRIAEMVSVGDFLGGIFKGFVFGVIVAAVGCQRGLETGKGAGAVGLSTTSAVVSGITLIAVIDGIFAVVFYMLGI